MSGFRNSRRPSRRSSSSHRGNGTDPRNYFGRPSDSRPDRKVSQLCKQVLHTLEQVLSGECNDDVLRGLSVVEVRPAPDATCLLVFVSPLPGETIDPIDALERLGRVRSKLRYEIANAISRKKVPELLFTFTSPNADLPAEAHETPE